MEIIFERGDRDAPVGHALIYFRADSGAVLATYVSVAPISFDLSSYIPPMFAEAMQGVVSGGAMVAIPMPPIPEEVASVEYLQALAERRRDDLVYAGATMRSDPGRLMQDAAIAAQTYGELYDAAPGPETIQQAGTNETDTTSYEFMTEREQLDELTNLTGRLRDSLRGGSPDPDIERQMRSLAGILPAKYRAPSLVEAASIPGERGQKLAELYLQRSYKLQQEEYLDLERIDREIEAIGD